MKTAKRVLALIVTLLMIASTCAVAASAADSLQAQINAGATEITLTKNTKESITINGDVTVNLAGYRLTGADGKAAITVKGGNVTITDGQVVSKFGDNVPSAQMLQNLKEHSPSAIVVTGGHVTIDGVRVVGSLTRIPTTSPSDPYTVPTGSAIQTRNGATVTLKRAALFGDYGVNNKVRENNAGGAVTVEDAVILAYNRAISGTEIVAPGTEKVNAADRIAGVLNSGIKMEEREVNLMKKVLGQRAMIYTKSAETLTELLGADKPVITVTEGKDFAEVKAPVLDYTWPNTKGTDCSYKLVPEAVVLSDGSTVALDKVDASKVDTEDASAQTIKYRIEFKMNDEVKPYVDDYDNYIDLNWWAQQADERYAALVNNASSRVDSYNEVLESLGDVLYMLDSLGNKKIGDKFVDQIAEYATLRQKLVEIGGAAAYNASADREYAFGENQYKYYFGQNAAVPADGIYGTLDRVAKLKNELEGFLPFTKTQNWGSMVAWAYDNYEEVIDIMDTLIAQLDALNTLLKGETYQAILDLNKNIKDKVGLLEWALDKAKTAQDMIHNQILENGTVKNGLATVERNKDEIKYYVDKAVNGIENYRTYVTPENFIDGEFLKTYSAEGPADVEKKESNKKLDLIITGIGSVSYSMEDSDGAPVSGVQDDDALHSYDFVDGFTLTAVESDSEFEFLYWINKETNRILSTEKVFTLNTNVDRAIEAAFGAKDETTAVFVNPTGDISGYGEVDGEGDITIGSDVMNAYVPGYAFESWKGAEGSRISAATVATANKNAYADGGASAFASTSAYYGPEGAILEAHPHAAGLIITPVYSLSGEYTVRFVDGAKSYKAVGPFGNVASVTASGADFSYWADETGKAVYLDATFDYTINREATFHAVYGAPDVPEYVTNITGIKRENGVVTFYAERSSKIDLLTAGVVFSYTNENPELGGDNVKKGTAKFNTMNGVYMPALRESSIAANGGHVYIRPYIEVAGVGVVYGDVYTY